MLLVLIANRRAMYIPISKTRVQITKVSSIYCEILDIIFGIPKVSILGPASFSINIIDPFLIVY